MGMLNKRLSVSYLLCLVVLLFNFLPRVLFHPPFSCREGKHPGNEVDFWLCQKPEDTAQSYSTEILGKTTG